MAIKEGIGFVETRKFYGIDPREIIVEAGWNPRTDFSGEEELIQSIIENGVKRPVILKRNAEDRYVLVDGERRLRATLKAIAMGHDIKSIPAILESPKISQTESLFDAIIANDGKPFDPLEEGEAFRRLVAWGNKVSDIAKRLGKSVTHVQGRIDLSNASPVLKDAVKEKRVNVSLATQIQKKSKGDESIQRDLTEKASTGKEGKAEVKKTVAPESKKGDTYRALALNSTSKDVASYWFGRYVECTGNTDLDSKFSWIAR